MRPRSGERADPAKQRARELRHRRTAPQLAQPGDAVRGWVGGEHRAVDGAHRRAEDDIRFDRARGERLKHPNLMSAEDTAPAKYERHLVRLLLRAHCDMATRSR